MECAFLISWDVNYCRRSEHFLVMSSIGSAHLNWFQQYRGVPCHLFPIISISVGMAQQTRVDSGGHYLTEVGRQPARPDVFLRGTCYTSRSIRFNMGPLWSEEHVGEAFTCQYPGMGCVGCDRGIAQILLRRWCW